MQIPEQSVYADRLPSRVRVFILGGGIHGVGLSHDLASRGWQDIHLVEKNFIGSGASSRSTKLIHGGLRYLQNIRDFGLVHEALGERETLRQVVPDLVYPVEFYLPVLPKGGTPAWVLGAGLRLYDFLAGNAKIQAFDVVSDSALKTNAQCLDTHKIKSAYSFWDMQTDDLALVRRVAASARALGGGISENTKVIALKPDKDGWLIELEDALGNRHGVSARYVYNSLGPWSDQVFAASGLKPPYRGVNSKGIHLLIKRDLGLKVGLFLQSPEDKRIFFLLPWCGYTLVGTTESEYTDDPSKVCVHQEEVDYLLERCNRYLLSPIRETDISASFAGLRWLAAGKSPLGKISRKDKIGENESGRGLMLTLYGGKLTTYRSLSEQIGDRIVSHFGEERTSKTADRASWVAASDVPNYESAMIDRFAPGGVAYSRRD